ncbi:hypothetical protein NHQ30_001869 [Ciborinia camelliae]|nr:hypothetical protein NHQ30_001869 [Ciborinia camelliae]
MRSSVAIASLCAAFAVASPLVKKDAEVAARAEVVETHVDYVTNVVMVTVTGKPVIVTAGLGTASAAIAVTSEVPWENKPGNYYTRPVNRPSQYHNSPPPAPTSTYQSVVVITETEAASTQAPTTTEAPTTTAAPVTTEVAPTTTPEPVTTEAAPTTTPEPVTTEAAPTTTPEPVTTEVAPTTTADPVATSSSAPVVATTAVASATDALSPTAVTAHNNARASHQAAAMTWNQTLADWAAQEGSCTKFAHDLTAGGGGYGQNIAVAGNSNSGAYTTEAALNAAIGEWYAEESLFGALYGAASPSQTIGDFLHFTQIVWVGSHEVGCAVKTCGTDNTIYPGMYVWYSVCNYYPAGNVLGEFATNVLPAI